MIEILVNTKPLNHPALGKGTEWWAESCGQGVPEERVQPQQGGRRGEGAVQTGDSQTISGSHTGNSIKYNDRILTGVYML